VLLGAHKKVCIGKGDESSGVVENASPPPPPPVSSVVTEKEGPICSECGELQPSLSVFLGEHKSACAGKPKPDIQVGKLVHGSTMVVPVHDPAASKEALARARQCWAKSNIEDALRLSREAVQFDHRHAEALSFRAVLLNEKKQFAEAQAVALQSLQVDATVEGLLELARAELYLGNARECLKACFDVEGKEPDNKKMLALRKLATTALETGVTPKPKEGTKMDRAEKKKLAQEEKRAAKERKEQEKIAKAKAAEEEKKKKEEEEQKAAAQRAEQKARAEEEKKRKEEEERKQKEEEKKRKEEEKKLKKSSSGNANGKGTNCTVCPSVIPRGKKFCLDCGAAAPLVIPKPPTGLNGFCFCVCFLKMALESVHGMWGQVGGWKAILR